jgi:uncharacterized RDD family membrane protein YckC
MSIQPEPNPFSWGAETLGRRRASARGAPARSQRRSLLGARMAALVIDAIALAGPVLGAAFVLSLAFPRHGFFFSSSHDTLRGARTRYGLELPGALVVSALSLSYFFLCEVIWGRTVGKRAMGLRVRSAAGARAGVNAIAARTVLRLIDGIGLYLLGAFVAIISGSRRRRIGDWAAGTVVVEDAGDAEPRRPFSLRLAIYPVSWVVAVLIAVFALGRAVAQGEEAISLVRAYVRAREAGDGRLACAMLTRGQQREIVAIARGSYPAADPGMCPAYILANDPNSHLLNPVLAAWPEEPLTAAAGPGGAVVVRSSLGHDVALVAIPEGGRLRLDVRGLEEAGFILGCSRGGRFSSAACTCLFTTLRAQGQIPEATLTPEAVQAIRRDATRCGPVPTTGSS